MHPADQHLRRAHGEVCEGHRPGGFHLRRGTGADQELLHQMASENNNRIEIIDEDLYMKLREYATFRHFYRHAYSFQLDWDKMKNLVDSVNEVWCELKHKLDYFIKSEY